ncbi:MAG: type 4a pilus biogenesis protein PilO [Bdellovibrionales bacterium]|nr:type 4a pilus biogenesis protein PilO [Bdellovibrionales bacterium]
MTLLERLEHQVSFGKALLFGILVAGAYYSVGYDDGTSLKLQISGTKTQIQESESEIKGLEKQIERVATMKKVMEALGSEFDSFLAYIPEKFSLPELMRIITTEARSAGVSVNGISEMKDAVPDYSSAGNSSSQFYEELGVEVELQGTFSQLLLFLSYLTKLDKILTISQLSMASEAKLGDKESPIITFKCRIKGYRYLSTQAKEPVEG